MRKDLSPPAPGWFTARDYSQVGHFDASNWWVNVFFRFSYVAEANPSNVGSLDREERLRVWNQFLAQTSPLLDASFKRSFADSPIREDAEHAWPPGMFRPRMIAVDLAATDADLKESFTQWLKEQRERGKQNGEPGPRTSDITQAKYQSWTGQRILQVFDLSFYKLLVSPEISDNTIGLWTWPAHLAATSDPTKKVEYSRKVLESAFDLLEALIIKARKI